ncbi:MAG: TIGR03618 family F420-dependent PPOX class oxidoreductase [Chloroflexota bacterium]
MTHPMLSDRLRTFLDDTHFAAIATLAEDGSPHQAVIWYTLDADDLIINSAVGRRWPADLRRDPRLSVAITDHRDGYRWIGFSGRAEVITDQPTAQADIAGMARRYHADEPEEAERLIRERFERQERISFRVPVVGVHEHLD